MRACHPYLRGGGSLCNVSSGARPISSGRRDWRSTARSKARSTWSAAPRHSNGGPEVNFALIALIAL